MNQTVDSFLDGRVQIAQPKVGYRAATDPVYLAASIPAKPGETVLDVGCGVGTASLCLNERVPGLILAGIEVQDSYAKIAIENADRNNAKLELISADLSALPNSTRQRVFDHVMTNPPFFEADGMSAPNDGGKAVANVETIDLSDWISLSLKRLKPKGSFSIIHLADRLPEILAVLHERCGDIRVLPITARQGRAAKRILVQGIKTSKAPLQLLAPLVVHDGARHDRDGDDYSKASKQILRDGQPLTL